MKTGKVAGVLACLCLGLLTACQQTKEGNPISSLPGPIIGVQNPNTEPGGTGVGLPSTSPIGSVPPGQPSPLVPPPVSAPTIPPLPTPNPSPSIVGLPPAPLAAPTFTKEFSPNQATAGGSVAVIFTITNNAPVPLSGLSFIDSLPGGLRITLQNAVTLNTCGGTLTAPPSTFDPGPPPVTFNSTTIALQGGTLAPNFSCVVSVSVEQITPMVANYINLPVTLFSSGAPPVQSNQAPVTFN